MASGTGGRTSSGRRLAKHRPRRGRFAGAVTFGTHDVRTDRAVTSAAELTASFVPTASPGGLNRLPIWPRNAAVTPYAALQVQNVSTPTYTETATVGTGSTAQTFAARDTTSTRSEFGAWIDNRIGSGIDGIVMRGRLAWVHNFDRDAVNAVAFAVIPGANFIVNGAQRPGDAALLSTVAEFPVGRNLMLAGKFDGEFASRATT